jgi:hypothetical protein
MGRLESEWMNKKQTAYSTLILISFFFASSDFGSVTFSNPFL